MPALTPDALVRRLTPGHRGGGGSGEGGGGALDPVYFLYGDEDVRKEEAIRALLERALPSDARAFNLDQRGAGELDPQTLHTLVNTPPLMAATRAVVVRGVEQLKKGAKLRQELLRYLGAPNPTTLLLLVQGAGEKA